MATTTPTPRLVDAPGIRFGLGTGVLVVVLFGCAAAHLLPAQTGAAVGFVVASASLTGPWLLGGGLGLVGWAFYTGFVEHQYGVLTFTRGDLVRLAVLVGVGVAVATTTGRVRSVPNRAGATRE
jgi:hypothetical protein